MKRNGVLLLFLALLISSCGEKSPKKAIFESANLKDDPTPVPTKGENDSVGRIIVASEKKTDNSTEENIGGDLDDSSSQEDQSGIGFAPSVVADNVPTPIITALPSSLPTQVENPITAVIGRTPVPDPTPDSTPVPTATPFSFPSLFNSTPGPKNCGTVKHGQTETQARYQYSNVSFGVDCRQYAGKVTRTCNDGVLSNWTGATHLTFTSCCSGNPDSNSYANSEIKSGGYIGCFSEHTPLP